VGQSQGPGGPQRLRGGFLGLDNIGIFRPQRAAADRRFARAGGRDGVDGVLLPEHAGDRPDPDRARPIYEEIAFKFVQHFMWIAYAMDRRGEHHDEMWDEEDGFFYDLLRLPDGQAMRLKVRSLVGLLPLCASTVFEEDSVTRYPRLMELINQFRKRHPELVSHVAPRPTRDSPATRSGGSFRSSAGRSSSACSATCSTRTNSWGRTAFARCRAITSSIRSCFTSAARSTGCSTCRRNRIPACSAQFQLARSGVDAGQRADRPGTGEPVWLLRR